MCRGESAESYRGSPGWGDLVESSPQWLKYFNWRYGTWRILNSINTCRGECQDVRAKRTHEKKQWIIHRLFVFFTDLPTCYESLVDSRHSRVKKCSPHWFSAGKREAQSALGDGCPSISLTERGSDDAPRSRLKGAKVKAERRQRGNRTGDGREEERGCNISITEGAAGERGSDGGDGRLAVWLTDLLLWRRHSRSLQTPGQAQNRLTS